MTQRFLLINSFVLLSAASALHVISSNNVQTPESRRCPEPMTRCPSSGDVAALCCPYPNATCCPDSQHCCPQDMVCDSTEGSCTKSGSSYHFNWQVPLYPKMPESTREVAKKSDIKHGNAFNPKAETNKCADGTTCHFNHTCCKGFDGNYGCCPLDGGVCCTDGSHCCPKGSKCTSEGKCQPADTEWSLLTQNSRRSTESDLLLPNSDKIANLTDQICPDPRYHCPSGWTCCPLPRGGYSCCPYSGATCCPGGQQCCPHGFHCMPGYCIHGSAPFQDFKKSRKIVHSLKHD